MKSQTMVCAAALMIMPILATCAFEDTLFAKKEQPEKAVNRQESSPYWLRDLNQNGVTVARPKQVQSGLWADRPQVVYSEEALFARPVSRGSALAAAGGGTIVPISALQPDADPSAVLPPPPEGEAPPPAVISANYQSADLAQSAALVTDRLGPTFADHSNASVVLPMADKPRPGGQLRLGFKPVNRVQKAAMVTPVRRTPVNPVIATPMSRGGASAPSLATTPRATTASPTVAAAAETAPPAPQVPRTPVVVAALEDGGPIDEDLSWSEAGVASTAPAGATSPARTEATVPVSEPNAVAGSRHDGSFRLQLASLRDRGSASNEGARLKTRFGQILGDKSLVLESADLGSRGVFHRVQLGPYGSRDHASLACSDLKALGQDCLVVVR